MNTRTLWRKWWMWAGAVASIPLAFGIFLLAESTIGEPYQPEVGAWLRGHMRERFGPSNLDGLMALAPPANGMNAARGSATGIFEEHGGATVLFVQHYYLADAPVARGRIGLFRGEILSWCDKWSAEARKGSAWVDERPGTDGSFPSLDYMTLRAAQGLRASVALGDLSSGDFDGCIEGIEAASRIGDPLRHFMQIGPMIAAGQRSVAIGTCNVVLDRDLDASQVRRLAAVVRGFVEDPVVLTRESVLSESIASQELLYGRANAPRRNPFEAMAMRQLSMNGTVQAIDSYASEISDRAAWLEVRKLAGLDNGDADRWRTLALPWTRSVLVSSKLRAIARSEPRLMAAAPIPATVFGDAPPDERIFSSFPASWQALESDRVANFRIMATRAKLAQASCAMRAHMLENGAWPKSLDDLDSELWSPLPQGSTTPTPRGAPLTSALDNQTPYGPIVVGEVDTSTGGFAAHLASALGSFPTSFATPIGDPFQSGVGTVAPLIPGNVRLRWSKVLNPTNTADFQSMERLALLADMLAQRIPPERFSATFFLRRGNEPPRAVSPAELLDPKIAEGPDVEQYGATLSYEFQIEFPARVPAVWVACDNMGNPVADAGPNFGGMHNDGTYIPDLVAFPGGMLHCAAPPSVNGSHVFPQQGGQAQKP